MGFLEVLIWVCKVQRRLHKYAESIRNAEHGKRNQEMTRTEPSKPLEVWAIVSYDQKTAADTTAQDKRNHATQESIKNATWAAFYAVAAYAVVTTFMWCQMMKQTRILDQQLALARDADRPWVAVDVAIDSPLIYDGDSIRIGFDISPKNIGRSPAQNIFINPALKPVFMGDDLRDLQKHICENAQPAQEGLQTYLLFPGDHYTQPFGLGISVEEINSHWGKKPTGMKIPDPIPLGLVGCIDYTYEASSRHHQTGFALDVIMKDGRLALKSKTPIDATDLVLREHSFGGHFAN